VLRWVGVWDLPNPLSKLFRNCLKTEIESLKRI
jgi:hypothetical protein